MSVLTAVLVIVLMLPGAAFLVAVVVAFLFHGPPATPAPRPGRCAHCDHDLTGDAGGVCPGCGTAVPKGARP